jgi:uncharacterized repeat protein (TIGR03803 family)
VLHSFTGGSDGANPAGSLIGIDGVLYGTTFSGGAANAGTVFKITASGAESVLYDFAGDSDGANPQGSLTDVNGVLYGTTARGGDASSDGTVFEITTSGAERVLYRFRGGSDGSGPEAGLTNVDGVLFGTTIGGGRNLQGTVFRITTSGAESVLHSFAGGTDDGAAPASDLTDVNGVLYGTTKNGGVNGQGTVFTIATSGAERVLHKFADGGDGKYPAAGLTNVDGQLYGTTASGGRAGRGTVFEIAPSGTEKILHSFGGGNDGTSPTAPLTGVAGVLYGTTFAGGVAFRTGTVFRITAAGEENTIYRFVGGSDGLGPSAGLASMNGVLYGTTFKGGANNAGTVFSLSL